MMKSTATGAALILALAVAGCDEATLPSSNSPPQTNAPQADTARTVFNLSDLAVASGSVAKTHSRIRLSSKASQAYRNFQEGERPYGAMYVSANGTGYGWHRGSFTLEDAKLSAKATCDAVVKGGPCRLYATLEPPASDTGVTVPKHAQDLVKRARRQLGIARMVAIAVHPAGGFGVSWNTSNPGHAKDLAMQSCQKNVAGVTPDKNPKVFEAKQKAGVYTCRVFGVFR